MSGWKTGAGAALLIGVGLWLVARRETAHGLEAIGQGLGMIGIRHAVARHTRSKRDGLP
jgi:hypothetical protein